MYVIAFQNKPGIKTYEAIYIPRHSIIKEDRGQFNRNPSLTKAVKNKNQARAMETDSACFQANAMQSISLAREKLTQL